MGASEDEDVGAFMVPGIEASHREEYYTSDDHPDVLAAARVPGRMVLVGEYGVEGGGLALSTAVDRHMTVALSLRPDNSLRFHACDLNERKRTTLINLKYKREDRWANHLKVAVHSFVERGYPVRGLNCSVSGDIPCQIGLGSSAAMELATALALRAVFDPSMDDETLVALLDEGQRSFWGAVTHPVDWYAMLCAKENSFMVMDPALGVPRTVLPPFEGYRILLTDSRVPRLGMEGEIRQREKELRRGLELLSRGNEQVAFKDFISEDLIDLMGSLPEQIRRRAMHAVQESSRVLGIEEAFRKRDLAGFAKLVYHSHEGLRDLLEVSCPEIDWLVKRSQEIDGVLCSRMLGKGFGGCIYSVIAEDAVEEYRGRLEEYERIFGFKPVIHEVNGSGPAHVIHSEGINADTLDK